MADAKTPEAAPKKKRAAFTRTEKPVYLIISYTGDDGQPMTFDKSRLSVTATKDTDNLVELLTDPANATKTVVKVEMQKKAVDPAPAPAAA